LTQVSLERSTNLFGSRNPRIRPKLLWPNESRGCVDGHNRTAVPSFCLNIEGAYECRSFCFELVVLCACYAEANQNTPGLSSLTGILFKLFAFGHNFLTMATSEWVRFYLFSLPGPSIFKISLESSASA
jgi:hypothetical protein